MVLDAITSVCLGCHIGLYRRDTQRNEEQAGAARRVRGREDHVM